MSSFCIWLVKRDLLPTNPVEKLDRPKVERMPPRGVPESTLMDALMKTARQRGRPRDIAMFLVLRYTGMRRDSVATLMVKHLDPSGWLRGVRVKGGALRDIPLPARVMQFLEDYVKDVLRVIDALDVEYPGDAGGRRRRNRADVGCAPLPNGSAVRLSW